MNDNFNWFIANIHKYANLYFYDQNITSVNLPDYVKQRYAAASGSLILWWLKNDNLFGIKRNEQDIIIHLDSIASFRLYKYHERGNITGTEIKIVLKSVPNDIKILSGDSEWIEKLFSVLRLWFGDKVEYMDFIE